MPEQINATVSFSDPSLLKCVAGQATLKVQNTVTETDDYNGIIIALSACDSEDS